MNDNEKVSLLDYSKMRNGYFNKMNMDDDAILKYKYAKYMFKDNMSFDKYKEWQTQKRDINDLNNELNKASKISNSIRTGSNKVLSEHYQKFMSGEQDKLEYNYDINDTLNLFNKDSLINGAKNIYKYGIDKPSDFLLYVVEEAVKASPELVKEVGRTAKKGVVDAIDDYANTLNNVNDNIKLNEIEFLKNNITDKEKRNVLIKKAKGIPLNRQESQELNKILDEEEKERNSTMAQRVAKGIGGGITSTATYQGIAAVLGADSIKTIKNPILMTLAMPLRIYNSYQENYLERTQNLIDDLRIAEMNGDIQATTDLKNNLQKIADGKFSWGDLYKAIGQTFVGNWVEKYVGDYVDKKIRRGAIWMGGRELAKKITKTGTKYGVNGFVGELMEDWVEQPIETALNMNHRNDNLKNSDNKSKQYGLNVLQSLFDNFTIENGLTTLGSVYIQNQINKGLIKTINYLNSKGVSKENVNNFTQYYNEASADEKQRLEERAREQYHQEEMNKFNSGMEDIKTRMKEFKFDNITDDQIDKSAELVRQMMLHISLETGVNPNSILNKYNVSLEETRLKNEIKKVEKEIKENKKDNTKNNELEKELNKLKEQLKQTQEESNKYKKEADELREKLNNNVNISNNIADNQERIVYTPNNRPVKVKYEVVDLDSLIPSTDLDGNVNKNYLAELQPRDRSRQSSREEINKIANNLNPSFLEFSNNTTTGAPIIGEDNMVESGNGRVLSLQLAYDVNNKNIENYKQFLKDKGFNIDGINKPVLIRRNISNMDLKDRIDYTRESNTSDILNLSAGETARQDSKKLNEKLDIFNYYDTKKDLSDNIDFAKKYLEEIVPSNERNNFLTTDGKISSQGIERIQKAFLGTVLESDNLLSFISEDQDNKLKTITRAVINIVPNLQQFRLMEEKGKVKNIKLLKSIQDMFLIIDRAKQRNENPDLIAREGSLFKDDNLSFTQLARDMVIQFYNKKRDIGVNNITNILNKFIDSLKSSLADDKNALFKNELLKKDNVETQIFNDIANIEKGNYDEVSNKNLLLNLNQETQDNTIKGQYDMATNIIRLFKDKSDVSTILHETAHWYKMMLQDYGVKDDLEEINKFLDTKVKRKETDTDQDYLRNREEYFARSFEAYLTENKSLTLSEKMEGIFESIKQFLMKIYENIINLNVELTPGIRNYFNDVLTREYNNDIFNNEYETNKNDVKKDMVLSETEQEKQKTQREKIIEEMGGLESNTKLSEMEGAEDLFKDIERRPNKIIDNVKDTLTDALRTSGDVLRNINEDVYNKTRMTSGEVKINEAIINKAIKPFIDGLEKIEKKSKSDFINLSIALGNSDMDVVKSILNKYNMMEDYLDMREAIKGLAEEVKKSDPRFEEKIENYFPRKVAPSKLQEYLGAQDYNMFNEIINEEEQKKGIKYTDEQRMKRMNDLIKKINLKTIFVKDKTGNITKRREATLDTGNIKYYEKPQDALKMYVKNAIQYSTWKKFFGGVDKETSENMKKLRNKQRSLNTALQKGNVEKANQLQNEIDTIKEMIGVNENLENSIGRYVSQIETLSPDEANKMVRVLNDIINPATAKPNPIASFISKTAPVLSMNSVLNALKQLKEIPNVFARQGYINALNTMFSKNSITMEDLGLDDVFQNSEGLGKISSKILWLNTKFDSVSKAWTLRADIEKMQNLIKKNDAKFNERLESLFGAKSQEVKNDILNENKNSTELKQLLYLDLGEMQPIDNLDKTLLYLENPFSRYFYILKAYSVKQANFRYNLIKNLTNEKDIKEQSLKLGKYVATLWLLNTLGTSILGMLGAGLFGRKEEPEDIISNEMIDNIPYLDNLKEQYDSLFKYDSLSMTKTPLLNLIKDIIDDTKKGKMKKTIKYVPFGKDVKYAKGDDLKHKKK